ncbi:MAG: hypothetical protein M1818_005207 [Claussenomyces sp. TS43310]|nr:MAG: hypothetical protein M1818_005207 [Claussenomyces sp. TS43310]
MHILVVNDDGPPSNQSSPYVQSLVTTLQEAGHVVSVCLPHTQRSWIGKAHMIGQTVKPTYFRPGRLHEDDGTTHSRPSAAGSKEEWVLVDGTPASCVQIGIYHFFHDRGPIDLVVSGPNYGRNSTAVFGLSSGTLGGALEAAVCRKKAIAISYAFQTRVHDPIHIANASKLSVRLVEYLHENWGPDADLYSVNIPLVDDVGSRKVLWTNMLQNYWGPSSCFEEAEDDEGDAEEAEQRIREGESDSGVDNALVTNHKHKHFKWAPKFLDVHKAVAESEPGNDGWAVKEGYTSVTPLKANFMHAAPGSEGELKLPLVSKDMKDLSISNKSRHHFSALIDYGDDYVQPLILKAIKSRLPKSAYTIVPDGTTTPDAGSPYLQIRSYEELNFEDIMAHPTTCLANSYVFRKALIRKHYLSMTAHNWVTKHPTSALATHMPPSCDFELDYAEFLDDALVEAWELHASFERNEDQAPQDREWWILKPGMSDRGQGIRLFSTQEELQAIFDGWEADRPDSDDEEDGIEPVSASSLSGQDRGEAEAGAGAGTRDDYIMTSQLRHFVAQPYIHPPLLLASNPRKFHIRAYVVAVGALKVYVYRPMLALFAAAPYVAPGDSSHSSRSRASTPPDLAAHLTNTCLQDGTRLGAVQAFWQLPTTTTTTTLEAGLGQGAKSSSSSSGDWRAAVFGQICAVTGEIFEAAARGMPIHFQTLPNAFEVFGLDFLVDAGATAHLLEINAFPDFAQTGAALRDDVVAGLWAAVVDVAVAPFFGLARGAEDEEEAHRALVLVRDLDLGRR